MDDELNTSAPAATPLDDAAIYGPAKGVRLASDEQDMLNDLICHYGENRSQVIRIALRHLYESLSTPQVA